MVWLLFQSVFLFMRLRVSTIFSIGDSSELFGTILRCLRFLLVLLCDVSTIYDLGAWAVDITLPGVTFSPEVIHTSESFGIGGKGRTLWRRLKSLFCFCLNSSLSCLNFSRYCQVGVSWSSVWGMLERGCLPISNCAGERLHKEKVLFCNW